LRPVNRSKSPKLTGLTRFGGSRALLSTPSPSLQLATMAGMPRGRYPPRLCLALPLRPLPCPPWQRLQPPGQLNAFFLSKILRFTPSACSPRPVRDRTRGGSGLAAYAKLSNLALDLSTQLDVCEKALSPAVRGVEHLLLKWNRSRCSTPLTAGDSAFSQTSSWVDKSRARLDSLD
jgi:hypothetical protein